MPAWVVARRSPEWRSSPLSRSLNKKALRYLDRWATLAEDTRRRTSAATDTHGAMCRHTAWAVRFEPSTLGLEVPALPTELTARGAEL